MPGVPAVSFDTDPSRYRHLRLETDGEIAQPPLTAVAPAELEVQTVGRVEGQPDLDGDRSGPAAGPVLAGAAGDPPSVRLHRVGLPWPAGRAGQQLGDRSLQIGRRRGQAQVEDYSGWGSAEFGDAVAGGQGGHQVARRIWMAWYWVPGKRTVRVSVTVS